VVRVSRAASLNRGAVRRSARIRPWRLAVSAPRQITTRKVDPMRAIDHEVNLDQRQADPPEPEAWAESHDRTWTRDEWHTMNRERLAVNDEYERRRKAGMAMIDAGDRQGGAHAVWEASMWRREQCARLDAMGTPKADRRRRRAPRRSGSQGRSVAPSPTRRTGTRSRGAGRPAARRTTSGAASGGGGSSGDSDLSDPPPPASSGPALEREYPPLDQRHVAPPQQHHRTSSIERGRS
jgi:hypothetical protein